MLYCFTMRTFIAFPLPEQVKHIMQNIQEEMKKLDKKFPVRWTDADKLHVTLEFLGELSPLKVEQVEQVLSAIIPYCRALEFQLTGIDAFPNRKFPRVLFVGVKELSGEGSVLHTTLTEELKKIEIYSEHHEWHPHITLGRVTKHWSHAQDFLGIPFEKVVWNTKSIQLLESVRQEGKYYYTVLNQLNFKAT